MYNSIIKIKRLNVKQWLYAILGISENYSQSDATRTENTQLQMVLSFRTSSVGTKKFCYGNKSSLKWAGIFIPISMNITSLQWQSFQTLKVRGFQKSSLFILYPSYSSLSSTSFLQAVFSSPKNIYRTTKWTPGAGEEHHKKNKLW